MRFVCDSCRAQYMISDDKVGAKGVKVRCKKCGYNIVVRPAGSAPAKEEGTSGEAAGGAAASQESNNDGFGLPPTLGTPPEGGIFSGVEDDELGAVFDQVLNSGSHRIPAGEASSDGPAQLDASALSDAGETVRKLTEAEPGSTKSAASHEWFVAIDEKQVGPLSMEKVKDYWERGEVGPDSLCWRAGFSDWIPLSEATELASVLAPRPTKPVIVEPVPMASSSPVASGPVESAFSAGGGLSKSARSDTPAPMGPSAQESGWKPSAASVLASLVKEENEALSKPASKAAPVEEKKVKPAASGLLDVPPPESAPVAASSSLMAELPAPTPYMQPAPAPAYAPPAQAYAQPMAQSYAPPPAYPGYPPQAAPVPKQGGKMGMIIAVAAGVVVLVGGAGAYFATRSSEQPGSVTPPAATQQQVAQAPATATAPSKPAELPPMPPPPAGAAQNTGTPAAGTAQPATAPGTAPSTAPAVAAVGTPGTAPTANPATPPPAEPVKSAEPPKTEPQQVARAEVPARRNPTSSRPPPTRGTSDDDEEQVARNKPQPKSSGSADDEFDELFGTKKTNPKNDTVSANGRTAYIPPEPGGGGAALDRLGQSDIMQVVLTNKPAIIKCVNEQKKKDPGLSGKLVMRWTIQTNGKTKNVSCQTSEFRSTYMASCISGLIKGWTFPKHKVQGEPIDFPFTF